MSNETGNQDPLKQTFETRFADVLPEASRLPADEIRHSLQLRLTALEMQNDKLRRENFALKESRDRYADLGEFAPVGYLMLSHMAKIHKVNTSAAMLLGMDIRNLRQRNFENFVIAENHDIWRRGFMDMISSDNRQTFELEMKRGDGECFHAMVVPLGSTSYGKERVIRIALTDISERKRSERESMALLQRYQILMKTSLDGIHIMDLDGNLLEANDAFCNMLGYTQDEAMSLNITDWEANWTGDELRSIFRDTIGTSRVIETLHRRKDGALLDVEISVSNVILGGRYYIFSSSRDVTERKRAASELLQASNQLHELMAKYESSREAERRSIAREVHDELGQLLSTLRLDISMIRLRFCKDNHDLMALVKNMTELVDSAIHGVRNVSENLRPAVLGMGIVAAIEWLCGNFSTQTGIPCFLAAPDQEVKLEEERAVVIFRIVQESLTNIMRYAYANNVKIVISICDDLLCVEVRDNGRGFDMGAAKQRASFGLMGMRERAWSLGGQLDIASAIGKGTVIAVKIPILSGA